MLGVGTADIGHEETDTDDIQIVEKPAKKHPRGSPIHFFLLKRVCLNLT